MTKPIALPIPPETKQDDDSLDSLVDRVRETTASLQAQRQSLAQQGKDLSPDFEDEKRVAQTQQQIHDSITSTNTTTSNSTLTDSQNQPSLQSTSDSTPTRPKPSGLKSNLLASKYGTTTKPMKQSNLTGATSNNTRYTLNFNVPVECKGTAGMRSQLLEIYAKMREFCPTVSILPWYTDKDLSEITSPDKIPETITLLQKYFPGVRPLDSGGMNYAKVNLAFPITVDRPTFEKDIDSWGGGRNMRFYQTPVQHANVKTACWLRFGVH